MFTKYPQPGEIWEYTKGENPYETNMWHIIEVSDEMKGMRIIMRVDGVHRTTYVFTSHRLKEMWRKVA